MLKSLWQIPLVRFTVVGATAAFVHLSVVAFLVEILAFKPLWANVPAFFVAFMTSYLGQRYLTFKASGGFFSTISRWFIVALIGFILNQSLFSLLLFLMPQVNYLLILTIVTGLVAFISYLLGKLWVFSLHDEIVPVPAKQVMINADDFGFERDIDRAIVDLMLNGRVSSTSLMSLYEPDIASLSCLKELHQQQRVNVGLHLDLTSTLASSRASGRSNIKKMIQAAWLRQLSYSQLIEDITEQIIRFELLMGTSPDFIDGHEHVHQFPVIRRALLDVLIKRYGKQPLLIRCTQPKRWRGLKATVIAVLGASKLRKLASQAGYVCNRDFAGVYGFENNANLAGLWSNWLMGMPSTGGMVMCHPSQKSSAEFGVARVNEYEWISSEELGCLFKQLKIEVKPFSTTADQV